MLTLQMARAVTDPDARRQAAAQLKAWAGLELPVTGMLDEAYHATFLAQTGEGAWEAAVTHWRELTRPYPLGECLVRGAEHALASGGRPRAAEWLREAHAIFQRLGTTPLLVHVERLAAQAHISIGPERHPNPRQRTHFGLTPKEFAVLALVSEGLSNKQIGERLFISPNTAGVHVSNILAKLNVASRMEAATLAYRLGFFKA